PTQQQTSLHGPDPLVAARSQQFATDRFVAATVRTNLRISEGLADAPTLWLRQFTPIPLKRARCQEITVSGRTITSADAPTSTPCRSFSAQPKTFGLDRVIWAASHRA